LGRVMPAHHGTRITPLQPVALVVDDEHPAVWLAGECIERAAHHQVAEQEAEALLTLDIGSPGKPGAQIAGRERPNQIADHLRLLEAHRPLTGFDDRGRRGDGRPAKIEPLEQRVDEDPTLGAPQTLLARPRAYSNTRHAQDAL